MADWLSRETTATQPYLIPCAAIDAAEDVDCRGPVWLHIVDRLASVGLTAYSVDHSRPDVTLRTVRAVVPGLRHIWNRRAPGRLFDVPVKLGWLPERMAEDQLNPIRCMV
jgi:ribosomal protein S12 methylthiotransferase accessory factor